MPKTKDNPLFLQLESCRMASQVLNQTKERDRIPQLFLGIITHPAGLGYDRALLFLIDPQSHTLRLKAAKGPINRIDTMEQTTPTGPEDLETVKLIETHLLPPVSNAWNEYLGGFVLPIGLGVTDFIETDVQVPLQVVIGKCAFNRKPYYSNNVKAVFEPPPAFGKEILKFERLAALPLKSRDDFLGVLMVDNFFNQREIGEIDLIGLDVMANLFVTAIESSYLNKKLEESTQLDGVTGAYSRQHFEASLDLEIDRAEKAGKPLSLLAFHLHNANRLHQDLGWYHSAKLMKTLAESLKKGVRSEDMIVRFGRADFLILLTGGASVENTMVVGQKLIQELTQLQSADVTPTRIQISGALGSLPACDLSRPRVASMADKVLDLAKRQPADKLAYLKPKQ